MFISAIISAAIAAFAPVIAHSLQSPVDSIRKTATELVKNTVGIDVNDYPDKVKEQIVHLSGAQQLALKDADTALQLKLANLDNDDLAKKYQREVALADTKWGWISLAMQNLGAFIIMALLITMTLWGLFHHDVDPQNQNQIINTNYNIVLLLVGYWWGKSRKEVP